MRVVAVGLIPAGAFATGVSDDETEEEVATEPPEAECDGCWVGLGDGEDGVIGAGLAHGLDEARPAPIGGDERLGEGAEGFGEGEDGAAEGELEANEIDGNERGLFGGFHEAGEAEADESEGGVDEDEEEGLVGEISIEVDDEVNEDGHPDGLDEDEGTEEAGFGGDVGGDADAGEFFFFEDEAFAGDFAGAVIGADEGEEDDLEHHEAGDEAAAFHEFGAEADFIFELFEDVAGDDAVEVADLGEAVEGEDDDEDGEADEESDLEVEAGAIAEENFPAAGEEDGELGEGGGGAVVGGREVFGWVWGAWFGGEFGGGGGWWGGFGSDGGEFGSDGGGGGDGGFGGDRFGGFVGVSGGVSGAMFLPGAMPIGGGSLA